MLAIRQFLCIISSLRTMLTFRQHCPCQVDRWHDSAALFSTLAHSLSICHMISQADSQHAARRGLASGFSLAEGDLGEMA